MVGLPAPSSTILAVQDLLPPGHAAIEGTVHVAPIPAQLQNALVKPATTEHFSRPHLQHMDHRAKGTQRENTKNQYPVWTALSDGIIPEPSPDLPTPNLSIDCLNAAWKELETATKNLWKGDTYDKALRYLVLALLRRHLAPRREENLRLLRDKKRAQWKEEQEQSQLGVQRRQLYKKWKGHLISVANQVSRLLATQDTSLIDKGLLLLELLERIWTGRPQDNDIPNKLPIRDLLDKGEVRCGGGEVHHDLQKEALSDLDYDGEPDEEEVRAGASTTSASKNIGK